jgi:Spy/CpxP family protein refolding chaperone
MKQTRLISPTLAALVLAIVAGSATAQQGPPAGPPGEPPRIDFAKELSIPADKASQVEAILKAAHEKRRALQDQMRAQRDETRGQLAKVLNAEQLAKLESLMPPPPGPPRGGPRGGGESGPGR